MTLFDRPVARFMLSLFLAVVPVLSVVAWRLGLPVWRANHPPGEMPLWPLLPLFAASVVAPCLAAGATALAILTMVDPARSKAEKVALWLIALVGGCFALIAAHHLLSALTSW